MNKKIQNFRNYFTSIYIFIHLFIPKRIIEPIFNHTQSHMNSKSKHHFEYLSSLNYYDTSQFIISSNQSSLPKSQSIILQKKDSSTYNQSQINDIFSMQYMKQYNQIKEFIQSQQEPLPLLIKSQKNKGKKTLLCQVINHYQKHSPKTKIFIANFASVNKVYSEILYNIMVKLRITFGINQKVQVNEQKIRRFFKYWLDVSSDQIQKDNLGYTKAEKQTLCIIIDGIDQLTNSRGEKVFPQFWLPQCLPKNVKLILSGTQGQMAIQKLEQQNKVKVMNLTHKLLSQKLKNKLKPQIRLLLQNRHLSLFEIKTLTWFLTTQQSLKFSSNATFNQIIQSYIIACSGSLKENEIKSLLLCLSLSKKGLTEEDLRKIMKIKPQLVLEFLYMFQPLVEKYQSYYLITNPEIKVFIQQVYDPNKQKKQKYHEIIGKVIKKGQMSIRKLQQEIHHLFQAQNYFEIKEVITEIQNFLLLYTPPCKYLLCNTWKMLEYHLNSDPVFEYNKAIQSFLTHYHPKEQQLFKIIFQLSMFFREYSQFEGAKIPCFRHPLIKGDDQQLQQICVFDELKHHKMTTDLKIVVKKNVDTKSKNIPKSKDNKQGNKCRDNIKQQNSPRTISSELQIDIIKSSSSSLQLRNQHNNQLSKQNKIQQIQSINLQIKQNRQKFKQYYVQILKPYLKQFYIPIKKQSHNDQFVKSSNNTTEEDQDQQQSLSQLPDNFIKQLNNNIKQIKSSMILKNLDQYFEENYHREEITKFYYYKQWLWIQFPWICQSLNYNFSNMIQSYIANPTQYMNMDTEINLIKDVMKISQVSKQNKSAIFQNKPLELISINPKKLKKNHKKHPSRNHSAFRNSLEINQNQLIPNRKSVNVSYQISNQAVNNGNIAKFELNLSKIDEKLTSQMQKQLSHRCAYDSRILAKSRAKLNTIVNNQHNQSSPFLTESSNKQNSSIIFPKIQQKISQSRYINESRQKSVNKTKLEQNQIEDQSKKTRLLTQLNTLTNQNIQLKSLIEQIQKTSLMLDNINCTTQQQRIAKKNQDLNLMKQKLQKKQLNQSLLKQKFQTIIKICDNNKSHQMESQLLSTFLQNLKIMCGIEQKQKQIGMKQFISFTQISKNQIDQLKQLRESLFSELKGQGASRLFTKHNQQEDQVTQHTLPANSTKNCLSKKSQHHLPREKQQKVTISSKHDSNYSKFQSKQRNRTVTRHPTTKVSTNKYAKPEPTLIWEQLSDIFQFDPLNYEQSIENSHYLTEQFEQKVTKYKQLNFMYDELSYQSQSLDDRIQNLTQQLKTLSQKNDALIQGQRSHRDNMSENQIMKQKMKQLADIKKRNLLLDQCLSKY